MDFLIKAFFDIVQILLAHSVILFFHAGGFGAWSIVINAFISDTSQPQDRSMRFGMLKLSETLGKPLGALLGNYILNKGLINF